MSGKWLTMGDDEQTGGLEDNIIECARQVWRTGVNERAKMHADKLRECLDYWDKYKADCGRYGLDHVCHYYDAKTGEFFYEVSDEPLDLQQLIDEGLGVRGGLKK